MLMRKNLRAYQARAVDFLKRQKHAGLFLDMGLGKTVSTLTAIADLLARGVVKHVLLVAPLRPAQGVWRQEARKWGHLKHLTFKMLTGNERQRLMSMKSSAQIHIINVDNLRWLLYMLKAGAKKNGWPYDMLVIDESSMFKTPKAKRFNALRYHLHRFDRRVILTGTPAPKGLLDLWSQVYILDKGVRLGEQVARYRARFFSPSGYMGYGYAPDEGAEKNILKLISPLILTMRAEDYLDLPPTMKQEVYVDLPAQARKYYAKLEEEMFLELENGTTEALSAASLSSKCWQLANGALILEDSMGERTWQAVHDAKLEALEEVVEGSGGRNVLVAYWFQHDIARLKSLFPKAPNFKDCKNERQLNKLQDDWNAGKHRVAFIQPASGGHGLNLQYGGNTLVFFSMLWSRELYAQVIERIGAARQIGIPGRDHVMVKHIIARDTVDEVMLATQRQRHVDERRMITLLRDYRDVQEILA
jgi:SNF2 family DNA or RNA helicase